MLIIIYLNSFLEYYKNMTEKKYALNIFNLLSKFDMRDKSAYDKLSEEEKKECSFYVLMNWYCSAPDQNDQHYYYLLMCNDIINRDFWKLQKYKDLMAKLFSACGIGFKTRHEWIKPPELKKQYTKLHEIFLKVFGNVNEDEIKIILQQLNKDSIQQMFYSYGYQENEIKEALKEIK